MKFLSAVHTDVGIRKKVNQDSFCLMHASIRNKNIVFAVICDGMGGLKMGEMASSFLVNSFAQWFERDFSNLIAEGYNEVIINNEWMRIISNQNDLIKQYGQTHGVTLGTTLTVFLCVDSNYLVGHVGDSRLYRINKSVQQLTKDHSLVAMEVEQGKITAEQAQNDSRSNILLQCVGASNSLNPQFLSGKAMDNDVFMLCSDGFRHKIQEEELLGVLSPDVLNNEQVIKNTLVDLVELVKNRGEKDNITSIAIKCIKN